MILSSNSKHKLVPALVLAFALLAIACNPSNSSQSEQVPDTPAVQPTSKPSPTDSQSSESPAASPSKTAPADSTPTSTATSTTAPGTTIHVPETEIAVRGSCGIGFVGTPSNGTAPGPTPTPSAGTDGSDTEIAAFLNQVANISDHLEHWTDLVDTWAHSAETEGQQATLAIITLERLSPLCRALIGTTVPVDAIGITEQLSFAVSSRYSWAKTLAESIQCCGVVQPGELTASQSSSSYIVSNALSESRVQVGNINQSTAGDHLTVTNDVLKLEFTVPVSWIQIQNNIVSSWVLPVETQIKLPGSIGPLAWGLGTAVRAKALPVPSNTDLESQVVMISRSLGTLQTTIETQFDNHSGKRFFFQNEATGWNTVTDAALVDDRIYFVEAGCASEAIQTCVASLDQIIVQIIR